MALNANENQFIGINRGCKTTKIHTIVNSLGNPVHFILNKGEMSDSSTTVDLLSNINISRSK